MCPSLLLVIAHTGFEPVLKGSEPFALPLGQCAKINNQYYSNRTYN